jgi:hypothetical protein
MRPLDHGRDGEKPPGHLLFWTQSASSQIAGIFTGKLAAWSAA